MAEAKQHGGSRTSGQNGHLKTRQDIAENVERRGQAESDPIKKARIAHFEGVLER